MKNSSKKAIGVGAGVAAAALAAAAGAYLLSGKEGEKRKAKAKIWIEKARAEAAKKIESAKKISAEDYVHIVNSAIRKYGEMQDASAPEIIAAAKELRAEWKNIERKVRSEGRQASGTTAKRKIAKRSSSAKRRTKKSGA